MSDADVVTALEKASDSMYQSAKHIRALIQPMQGTFYSKSWAVQMVIKHNDFDRIYHLLNSTLKFRVQIPYRKVDMHLCFWLELL